MNATQWTIFIGTCVAGFIVGVISSKISMEEIAAWCRHRRQDGYRRLENRIVELQDDLLETRKERNRWHARYGNLRLSARIDNEKLVEDIRALQDKLPCFVPKHLALDDSMSGDELPVSMFHKRQAGHMS